MNHTLVRGSGNRDYVIARLQRDGRQDLLEDISDGRLSAYGAAVLMGWTTRRQTVAVGNSNEVRRQPFDPAAMIG